MIILPPFPLLQHALDIYYIYICLLAGLYALIQRWWGNLDEADLDRMKEEGI